MAQNYETLSEQLERQGIPLATRMDILARARRADYIAGLIVEAIRGIGALGRAALRRAGAPEHLRRA